VAFEDRGSKDIKLTDKNHKLFTLSNCFNDCPLLMETLRWRERRGERKGERGVGGWVKYDKS
jgi:hypothetical protein